MNSGLIKFFSFISKKSKIFWKLIFIGCYSS